MNNLKELCIFVRSDAGLEECARVGENKEFRENLRILRTIRRIDVCISG